MWRKSAVYMKPEADYREGITRLSVVGRPVVDHVPFLEIEITMNEMLINE